MARRQSVGRPVGYHRSMRRRTCMTTVMLLALLATLAGLGAALAACGGSSVTPAADAAAAVADGAIVPAAGAGGGVPGASSVYTDLAYADASPAQKLDLYLPAAGEAPYPVIIAIHGGGFAHGDKADGQITPVLKALERGYAVAGVNYRLSGEATFPAAIHDVKAAVRWLRANAATYGLDPTRIAAWGHSAGGTLAALAGTSGGVAALTDPSLGNAGQPDTVRAVVDWYGPISFLKVDPDFRASGAGRSDAHSAASSLSLFLGGALTTLRRQVRAADPITYITADDPPVFIEHGTADGTVPVQQSKRFAAALARVLGPDKVTIRLFPGARHVDPAFFTPENVEPGPGLARPAAEVAIHPSRDGRPRRR